MANKIKLTSHFEKRYKRVVKKFVSLENDVDGLIEQLKETPATGEPLGAGLYKIRLTVKSKAKAVVSGSLRTW